MLAALFSAYIAVKVSLMPRLVPTYEPTTLRIRLAKIWLMWPIFLIMAIILIGIYTGIMTPAESAAVGASIALVMAIAYRRLTWAILWDSLLGTVRSTCMLLFIMIGASIVSGTLSLMRIPEQLTGWVDVARHIADVGASRHLSAVSFSLGASSTPSRWW